MVHCTRVFRNSAFFILGLLTVCRCVFKKNMFFLQKNVKVLGRVNKEIFKKHFFKTKNNNVLGRVNKQIFIISEIFKMKNVFCE